MGSRRGRPSKTGRIPHLSDRTYRVSFAKVGQAIRRREGAKAQKQAREEVSRLLFPGHEGVEGPAKALQRGRKENRSTTLSTAEAGRLLEVLHGDGLLEPQKLIAALAPDDLLASRKLTARTAEEGEIEISTEARQSLIAGSAFPVAAKYVSVFVDKVRFFQTSKEGPGVVIGPAEYVRIEPTSGLDGAVVLPVEIESGDVLLVTQYRHAPQKFVTEVPRGFGSPGNDASTHDTGRRELREETGRLPIIGPEGEEMYLLKESFTDTGKLSEKPSLFVAFVHRQATSERLARWNPAMEDPVWVSLQAFVRALFSASPVQLQPGEMQFATPERHLGRMRVRTEISQGILRIEDSFTLQAGLLALPLLARRFPSLIRPHLVEVLGL